VTIGNFRQNQPFHKQEQLSIIQNELKNHSRQRVEVFSNNSGTHVGGNNHFLSVWDNLSVADRRSSESNVNRGLEVRDARTRAASLGKRARPQSESVVRKHEFGQFNSPNNNQFRKSSQQSSHS